MSLTCVSEWAHPKSSWRVAVVGDRYPPLVNANMKRDFKLAAPVVKAWVPSTVFVGEAVLEGNEEKRILDEHLQSSPLRFSNRMLRFLSEHAPSDQLELVDTKSYTRLLVFLLSTIKYFSRRKTAAEVDALETDETEAVKEREVAKFSEWQVEHGGETWAELFRMAEQECASVLEAVESSTMPVCHVWVDKCIHAVREFVNEGRAFCTTFGEGGEGQTYPQTFFAFTEAVNKGEADGEDRNEESLNKWAFATNLGIVLRDLAFVRAMLRAAERHSTTEADGTKQVNRLVLFLDHNVAMSFMDWFSGAGFQPLSFIGTGERLPPGMYDTERGDGDEELPKFGFESKKAVLGCFSSLFQHTEFIPTCKACGTVTRDVKACSGCRAVWYCSRPCQVADWKQGHRANCKHISKKDSQQ